MSQPNLLYHLVLDRFPTLEFDLSTKIPLRVGESVMLHAQNCRVVARVKDLRRNLSVQSDGLGNIQGYRQIEGLDAWDNYCLEEHHLIYGQLVVEKLLALSGQEQVDEIPDFGTFAERGD
jgi:hypothetical protein